MGERSLNTKPKLVWEWNLLRLQAHENNTCRQVLTCCRDRRGSRQAARQQVVLSQARASSGPEARWLALACAYLAKTRIKCGSQRHRRSYWL